jgi:UDP-N-acetylmuramate--alanine ligase
LNIKDINRAHFIGIGGIGMSNLARYFISRGIAVSGYDRIDSEITKSLTAEGATICFDDQLSVLDDKDAIDIVVYTPAVPTENIQLSYFLANHDFIVKRAELLGLITKNSFCIAVAGTHGKTTTSSIVAHMLEYSNYGCTAFLGGIATNYNSNFILNKDSKNVVVEADEYDRSFLKLTPDAVILTSIDADHLDVYGSVDNIEESFQRFVDLIPSSGRLISNYGLNIVFKELPPMVKTLILILLLEILE